MKKKHQRNWGKRPEDNFADQVLLAIQAAGDTRPIDYDKDNFALIQKIPGSEERTLNLNHAWAEYLAAPVSTRHNVISKRVEIWMLKEEDVVVTAQTFDRAKLFPMIKARINAITNNLDCCYQVFAEHLGISLVRNFNNYFQFLNEKELAKCGLSIAGAHEIALKNLVVSTTGQFIKGPNGVFLSPWRDDYDATRILLTDRIRDLKLAGNPVAIVPNNNILAITGADNDAGILELIKIINWASEKPRFNCRYMFELTEEGWRPFLPSQDRAIYKDVKFNTFQAYGVVVNTMRRHLEKNKEFCVGDITYFNNEATITTWQKIDKWIFPKADIVAKLLETGKEISLQPWDDMAALAGPILKQEYEYPPLFSVNGTITDEQLATLKNRTIVAKA